MRASLVAAMSAAAESLASVLPLAAADLEAMAGNDYSDYLQLPITACIQSLSCGISNRAG